MQQDHRGILPLLAMVGSFGETSNDNESQLHAQVKPRLKRRKNHHHESDHPSNAALILLDLENLRPHFHLPLGQAAKKIGVCKTALKKACRKIGIVGWPFRKLRAVERRIAAHTSKRQIDSSKNVSGTARILKTSDDVVEKLLELKRQLLDGKDFGKGFSSLGIDEEDWSDLDMPMDGEGAETPGLHHEISMDNFDDHIPSTAGPSAIIHGEKGMSGIFSDGQSCCSASTSCEIGHTSRLEENSNEALNDILRSGGNPFANEFINLSNEFSTGSSCTAHSSWNPASYPLSEIAPSSFAQPQHMLQAELSRPPMEAGRGEGEAGNSAWTVRDELRSLQSLVRVLLKEQEELTNELKISQVFSLPDAIFIPLGFLVGVFVGHC
jgi:hypothetical protein